MTDNYFPIIGLEIHIQLRTKSKMFCGCSADWFGKKPNTLTCPVCLGLPGALPVPNKKALNWTIMLGAALNCKIAKTSRFDRKNYFYPDLPKGYQISQYEQPIAINGYLKLKTQSSKLKVKIRRVHLEEDTGKLKHRTNKTYTLVDFNRGGVALVEIVTEPDLTGSGEAILFIKKLRQIARYLEISDADMEKGSMRIEPNISVIKVKSTSCRLPNYKVEVKNINSFRFAKKAIDYEIQRQTKMLKRGITPKQETRGWDEKRGITISQRIKEEAHDYRYFPEPDIPPISFKSADIRAIKAQIKELPDIKMARFIKNYGLSEYNAEIIVNNQKQADYYEQAVKIGKKFKLDPKTTANWIINKKVDMKIISSEKLAELIYKETQKNYIPQSHLEKIIKKVLKEYKRAVEDYKNGKKEALGFLVGQVMKKTGGKANAKEIKNLLKKNI